MDKSSTSTQKCDKPSSCEHLCVRVLVTLAFNRRNSNVSPDRKLKREQFVASGGRWDDEFVEVRSTVRSGLGRLWKKPEINCTGFAGAGSKSKGSLV